MSRLRTICLATAAAATIGSMGSAPRPAAAAPAPAGAQTRPAGGIQWFSRLKDGLAEARKTGRPILFLSAAPSCGGVPGVW